MSELFRGGKYITNLGHSDGKSRECKVNIGNDSLFLTAGYICLLSITLL